MDAFPLTPITRECQLATIRRQTSRELRAQASTVRLKSATLHQQVRTFALRNIMPERPTPDADHDSTRSDESVSAAFLRLEQELDQSRAEAEHLRAALATRDLIWEAKLIIAVAMGCDAQQAHQVLVKQSQHENRKMREIAETIVQRRHA
jgi:hypothetical protein